MDKPNSLRALLTNSVPELKRDPSKLNIYINSGAVVMRYSEVNHGYQYRFRLAIEVRDFSGHPDQVFLPVVLWLRTHQPDLILNHDKADQAINFEADFLDNDAVDLDISLNLTESVDVMKDGDGYKMTHRSEPGIADQELVVDPAPLLKRVFDQHGKLLAGYPAVLFLTGHNGDDLISDTGDQLTEQTYE